MLTIVAMALGVAYLRGRARFTELTVEQLAVVDANGTRRMAITNRDRLPNLVIDGKEAARAGRAVQPAGIVLYDEQGNEAGGLVTTRTKDGAHMSMLVLDYGHSEAIGLTQRHTGDTGETALVLAEPAAAGAFSGAQRISLSAATRASTIELADTHGRPRIRLAVDAGDHPSIAILDDAGGIVSHLP